MGWFCKSHLGVLGAACVSLNSKEVAACPYKDVFGPEDDEVQLRHLGTSLAGLHGLCSQE